MQDKVVSEFWSSVPDTRTVWNHPLYSEYQIRRFGGKGVESHWLRIAGKNRFKNALFIGCGTGPQDATYYDLKIFEQFTGCDISDGALKVARERAGGRPMDYVQADFNETLPPALDGPFDLMYAPGSLHHTRDLEGFFSQIVKRMTDDAIFSWVEYCGPARFQWSPKVLKIGNAILDILPPTLKGKFTTVYRPRYHEIMATDPSEAVRGPEVYNITRLFFDVIEERDLGSTLLQPILNPIMPNFDDDNPLHTAIIKLILLLEETLMDERVIDSDSKFIVARKRN